MIRVAITEHIPEHAAIESTTMNDTHPNDPAGIRVSKLMAERGLCSRREADSYIERGLVFVDGKRLNELGTRTSPDAVITLAPEAQANQAQQMTVILNKPIGYVSGQAEDGHQPALTLIGPTTQMPEDRPRFRSMHLKGMAPAGRLDIDSTGLLVLTQDGRVARQLIGENSTVDKEYLVRVEGKLDERGLALLNHGLELDDRKLKPARVTWAECTMRSKMASASVGSFSHSCQAVTGNWLVINVALVPTRSSSSSSRSFRSAAVTGAIAKSSMASKSMRASCISRRAKLPSPWATRSSSSSRGALTYSTVKPERAACWASAHANHVLPTPVAPVISTLCP